MLFLTIVKNSKILIDFSMDIVDNLKSKAF